MPAFVSSANVGKDDITSVFPLSNRWGHLGAHAGGNPQHSRQVTTNFDPRSLGVSEFVADRITLLQEIEHGPYLPFMFQQRLAYWLIS